jgi:antitoxin CptB
MNTDASRLRWRCRRGMRELDQLLGWYLDTRYAGSDAGAKEAFSTLLDQQDPQLWDWLMGRTACEFPPWRRIIDEIRASDRV